jgi:DnaK suppressor protein
MHTKKFLTNVKERLLEEKLDRIKRSSQKIDIDTDGDETDEVQGNIQIELFNQFASLNKIKISLIDEALERIEKQIYGICVDCEEQIPEKRLLTSPYYVTCISCAEEREVQEKQHRRF